VSTCTHIPNKTAANLIKKSKTPLKPFGTQIAT